MVVSRQTPQNNVEIEEKTHGTTSAPLPIKVPSNETIKKRKVEIAKEFKDKQPGRIGRNVHKRSKQFSITVPEEFKRIVEAEQKLRRNDKERPVVYSKDGRALRPPKTQEEQDKELAELLWRLNCIGRIQSQWSDWEYKAFKNRVVFYDLCIKVSLTLLPLLFLLVAWDFFCALYFEIPHLSTLAHPGFVIPFHFMGTPSGMYGYMMRVLHFEKSRLTKYGLVCIICHPILFILRCIVEYHFNGFRNESSLRYEKYRSGVDDKPDDYDKSYDYTSRDKHSWTII